MNFVQFTKKDNMEHCLFKLSSRYPQLLFPISKGISESLDFKEAVWYGKEYNGILDYSFSEKDQYLCIDTPAGTAELLLLYNRDDFEKCVCALANKCEPKDIPPSVGAFMISGLINWEKVRRNCKNNINELTLKLLKFSGCEIFDRLILLSSGWYSGITPEKIGCSADEWTEKSITIRMYHELTHFICRSLYPKNIDVIRDEIFADMIGIVVAFGYYDTDLAKLVLGISDTGLSKSGRINYYIKNKETNVLLEEVNTWISLLERKVKTPVGDINMFIINLFEEISNQK